MQRDRSYTPIQWAATIALLATVGVVLFLAGLTVLLMVDYDLRHAADFSPCAPIEPRSPPGVLHPCGEGVGAPYFTAPGGLDLLVHFLKGDPIR